MEICALASGSSGNCFYIGNRNKSILVDAGISCKQIVDRLNMIGKNPEKIQAIFVTHEHSDHKKGIDVFSRKFNVPVFGTRDTLESSFFCSNTELLNSIKNHESVSIGNLEIQSFSKSHNAKDPVFFSISDDDTRVSVITDLGFCCSNVINEVSCSDALFIESNHDLSMLENGFYPYYLKKWIKGDDGHLSNNDSASCVFSNGSPRLKKVILSHLSENNNTPEQAMMTYLNVGNTSRIRPKIFLSGKHIPTPIFKI